MSMAALGGKYGSRSSELLLLCFILGPTHVTQTDVWVSRGDKLSLFKRRGDLIVIIGVRWRFKSRVSV